MAQLVYTAITSLDGYIEDERGEFGWSRPDPEVHVFVNDLEREAGTHLYGRRLYDVMVYWETAHFDEPHLQDYAEIWRGSDKVVYSRTLDEPRSERTRIEREFDPEVVRRLKADATRELAIGGAELAAQALRAGLVDEVRLFLSPVIVGGGKQVLPDGVRLELELRDERRFGNGVVYLRYSVGSGS